MPRRKRSEVVVREMDPGESQFIRLFKQFEMKDWDIKPWQEDLALASPVFMELLRQVHAHPESDTLLDLTAIRRWSTMVDALDPIAWSKVEGNQLDDQVVEDRGEAGVWGDYETAAWYAASLCPLIEPWHVCEMCY